MTEEDLVRCHNPALTYRMQEKQSCV